MMSDNDKSSGIGGAIKRTDKRYRGETLGSDLIGEDIPLEVQEWEAMSEQEREDALAEGKTPPKGART